jgi:hypothetical protein
MPHVTGLIHKEVAVMSSRIRTMIDALSVLNVMVPDDPEPRQITQFIVKESGAIEDKQRETIDQLNVKGSVASVMAHGFEGEPMAVKEQCRLMLASSGFTERGYDLVSAFEHYLASLATGHRWDQVDGDAPVELMADQGLTPASCYAQLGYWMALWNKAVEDGDSVEAARNLAIAALCKTVIDAAEPVRFKREGEPDLETMKAT